MLFDFIYELFDLVCTNAEKFGDWWNILADFLEMLLS